VGDLVAVLQAVVRVAEAAEDLLAAAEILLAARMEAVADLAVAEVGEEVAGDQAVIPVAAGAAHQFLPMEEMCHLHHSVVLQRLSSHTGFPLLVVCQMSQRRIFPRFLSRRLQ
jgi:hypothetical protein